jgi:hypothetical protein
MLKVFNEQLKQQQANMDREQQKVDFDNHVREVQTLCSGKCATAQKNGCRDEDVIQYCMTAAKSTKYTGYDFNDDNYIEGIANYALVDYCERNVYCPQIPTVETCACRGGLTMEKCGELLAEYASEHDNVDEASIWNGEDDEDAKIIWGDCDIEDADEPWTTIFGTCFTDGCP